MSKLYSSPLRVYLCLATLALAGLFCGLNLPVSLFPNSSKPTITVMLPYGSNTPQEFLDSYGNELESQLHSISSEGVEVEKITSNYKTDLVAYDIAFRWGTAPKTALKEVQRVTSSFASRLPTEIRDGLNVWTNGENSGFIAISFYSNTRSLDELYELLEPVLVPRSAKVQDAENPELWNPTQKEVRIELNREKMALLQLLPRDVDRAITASLSSYSAGAMTIGTQQLTIQMPRATSTIEDLNLVLVPTPSGQIVHLADIAKIDYGPRTSSSRIIKTSGRPSLILFATPRPGGNVKKMSEEIIQIVQQSMPELPKDIQYKILVDPSEFIRNSINNVFHEVLIGALLAVAILFLFIGSFKNTVTAAIEIPLSMILAFILMRFSGMNLNLISLGGLALSAGMNVDASVVVMENIFRHFEAYKGKSAGLLDYKTKLKIISQAVTEVRFAVIASTIASLVVFLPLAFTSELSYAVLGDLAKTVVFSHGFSAFVALILVPTVRLHLMSKSVEVHHQAPIEKWITRLEQGYAKGLDLFLKRDSLKWGTYGTLCLVLGVLFISILPKLPKEIIGTPDTDWMFLSISTQGNTVIKQMEAQADEIEARLLNQFGSKIQYTFNQIRNPNRATLMARLKNKSDMQVVWKEMENAFTNTPAFKYWVGPWNPAELPIPDPPQMRIAVRGGDLKERAQVAQQLTALLEEQQVFPRVWSDPDASRTETVMISPYLNLWPEMRKAGLGFFPADLADLSRVLTNGRKTGTISVKGRNVDLFLRYPESSVGTVEDLASYPISVGKKLVPLSALAKVAVQEETPPIYREDERSLFVVNGRENRDTKQNAPGHLKKAQDLVDAWKKQKGYDRPSDQSPTILFEDAEKDLHNALKQLAVAVGLSIALIYLTLIIQFGSFINAALVLVAIPLGFIGVLISLFVFKSTLSLNSILGVILLNGISVANSIILVDFLKQKVDEGHTPHEAAIIAGKKRLRPILITSLTTILGMLPVALGMGEGGRILQPLGIAVSGGLWVSMGLTLFIVPALQVSYLQWMARRTLKSAPDHDLDQESNDPAELMGLKTWVDAEIETKSKYEQLK